MIYSVAILLVSVTALRMNAQLNLNLIVMPGMKSFTFPLCDISLQCTIAGSLYKIVGQLLCR